MHHGGWGTGGFQKTAHVAILTKWRWFNCPGERVGPRRRLKDVTGCEEHPSAPMKPQVLVQLPDRLVPWRSEPRLAEAAWGESYGTITLEAMSPRSGTVLEF